MKEGYLPLYRKYRPQKLEDIVGQTHIKTALTNAINLNKISHAYLFTGPRGTGKTSTARILAKSLNCVNGPTLIPCEECESCKSITNSIPIDVIEMDAASNRSVEDAHNILEKVHYAPVNGKYRIYIIDEVHMLTPQAFNALLKTLEEPPKNVVFILATTEAHKVLDTIKSRCQRFDFKRITTNDIVEHLKKIAKKEKIKITDGAISTIAKNSAGGMRDSLALLDQVSIMGVEKEITEDVINDLLGRLSFDILAELGKNIINSDSMSSIKLLEKIYNDGNEPVQILRNLMMFFKNLLIAKTCEKEISIELTGLTEEQVGVLSEVCGTLESHQIIMLINKTADYIKALSQSTNQQMWLEVCLIDLSNLSNNTKLAELQNRLMALESGSPQPIRPVIHTQPTPPQDVKPAVTTQTQTTTPVTPQQVQTVPTASTAPTIPTAQGNDIKSLWAQVLGAISDTVVVAWLRSNANPVKISKDGVVVTFKNAIMVEKMNAPERKKFISDAVKKVFGEENISVIIREPLPDDVKIDKVKPVAPKKSIVPPKTLVEDEVDNSPEIETIKEIKSTPEGEQKPEKEQTNQTQHSDQSSMVKDLFDGKYID